MPAPAQSTTLMQKVLFTLVGVALGVALTMTFERYVPTKGFVLPPPPEPVQDRVRRVVLTWSGATNINPIDSLDLVIWGGTISQHDYDFQPGGADSLIRMLKVEFQKAPQRKIDLNPTSLGQKGSVKTFADLVSSIQ
jgi:hypothetical protein